MSRVVNTGGDVADGWAAFWADAGAGVGSAVGGVTSGITTGILGVDGKTVLIAGGLLLAAIVLLK